MPIDNNDMRGFHISSNYRPDSSYRDLNPLKEQRSSEIYHTKSGLFRHQDIYYPNILINQEVLRLLASGKAAI